uniref:Kinesin-like protein KIF9 n=1 Tax=Cacopsylla melanoneura TaxID=428564 RepID=A0A8D8XF30_9HEMI
MAYFVRPFPCENVDKENYIINENSDNIYIRTLHYKHNNNVFVQYVPDSILYNKSQSQVYETAIQDSLTTSLENKKDLMIFSIGQVHSGKTYTMMALEESPPNQGIVPRMLASIFQWKKSFSSREVKIRIEMSFIENRSSRNLFFDLLTKTNSKVIHVRDVTKKRVHDERTGLQYLKQGTVIQRKNIESSNLSNTIVTFHMRETFVLAQKVSEYKIHCIDSIGLDQRNNKGLIYNISSLITQFHSKYAVESREHFLLHYFGRQMSESQLVTLAHISLQAHDLNKTLSTMRLASPVMGTLTRIQTEIERETSHLRELRITFENLQKEAIMQDLLNDQFFVPDPGSKSEREINDIRKHAAQYFNKEILSLDHTDLESVHIICEYFKRIFLDIRLNKTKYLEEKRKEVLKKLKTEVFESILIEEQAEPPGKTKGGKGGKSGKKDTKKGEGDEKKSSKKQKQEEPPSVKDQPTKEVVPTENKNNTVAPHHSEDIKLDNMFANYLKMETAQKIFREYEELKKQFVDLKMKLNQLSEEYYASMMSCQTNQLECIHIISVEEKKMIIRENKKETSGKEDGLKDQINAHIEAKLVVRGETILALIENIDSEKDYRKNVSHELDQLRLESLHKQVLLNELHSRLQEEFLKYFNSHQHGKNLDHYGSNNSVENSMHEYDETDH